MLQWVLRLRKTLDYSFPKSTVYSGFVVFEPAGFVINRFCDVMLFASILQISWQMPFVPSSCSSPTLPSCCWTKKTYSTVAIKLFSAVIVSESLGTNFSPIVRWLLFCSCSNKLHLFQKNRQARRGCGFHCGGVLEKCCLFADNKTIQVLVVWLYAVTLFCRVICLRVCT